MMSYCFNNNLIGTESPGGAPDQNDESERESVERTRMPEESCNEEDQFVILDSGSVVGTEGETPPADRTKKGRGVRIRMRRW